MEKVEKKEKKEKENVNVVEVKVTEELVADTHLDQDDQEQDEVELQVRIMTDENGQQYYLDDAGNRYSLDLTPLDH